MAGIGKKQNGFGALQNEALDLSGQSGDWHMARPSAQGPVPQASTFIGIDPVGGEDRVNSVTAADQVAGSVTALTGGGYVIVWHGQSDGDQDGLSGQIFDAAGAKVGGEFRINGTLTGDQDFASVAALTDGGFVVTWEATNAGAQYDVYARRYGATGTALGSEFLVNSTTADWQITPQVAGLGDGGFIVTWSSNLQDGNGYGLYGQRYNGSGARVGTEFQISTTVTGNQDFSHVASLSGGGFVVVWESDGVDGSGRAVMARRYGADNQPTGPQLLVNASSGYTTGDQIRPSVTGLDGGGFVVVWQSPQDGSGTGIYAQLYSSAGARSGNEFRINETTAQFQTLPSVIGVAGGGFMVTWTSGAEVTTAYNLPVNGVQLDVYGRYFSNAGSAVSGEFLVNQTTSGTQTTNYANRDAVAQLVDGRFVFVWDGNGPGDGHGIFQRQFVIETNDPPDAVNDSVSTSEDMPGTFTVRDNDTDPDGDALTITAVGTPAHGSAVINGNGTITYTPVANYSGADSFTYTITDAHGATDTATVSVTVGAVNDAPVAVNDTASLNEDAFVDIAVRNNDTDIENNTLSITAVGTPGHGTAAINGNGTVRYTPNANYNGADSFTYTISDGGGGTATATVSVTVNPVNDPPVAGDDAATTDEDTPFAIAVLANDVDIDGIDTLTVTAVGSASHGVVAINSNGTIQYTPVLNYNGSDSFTYTVSDGHGGTDTASVAITLTPVNDTPTPVADARLINENTVLTLNALANDTDVDGDVLTITAVGAAAHGATAINPNGTLSYTPTADYFGVDTFTYTVSDGAGGTASATATITVNNIPEGTDERALTSEDVPVSIQVIANDIELDGDSLVVSAVANGAHGSVAIGSGGAVTYTPNLDFFGVDSFTYTLSDGRGGSDTATVVVTVEEVVDDGELMVNPVATANTRTHTEATTAALAGGGHVVVYLSYGDDDIYARRYGGDGLPIGEPFRVSTNTGGNIQYNATVAGLHDGGFVVVYEASGFDAGSYAVVGRRYDAQGVAMGGEFLVGPSNTATRDQPTVAALEDGGFVVAYEEDQTLAVQRFNEDGTPHGNRHIISTGYSYGQPAVAGLAGGGYLVTEQGYFLAGGVGFKTVGYLFDANDALVVGPYSLTQTPGAQEEERLAAVTALPDGGFVAVWQTTYDSANGRDVVARRFNADGSPAGDQFVVNTVTAGNQWYASVAALPDGRFIIDWESAGQDGDDPNSSNIYAQMYDPTGNRIGSPFRVNETAGGQQRTEGASSGPNNPTVAVLADGTIAFTWSGVGEGSSSGVFTRRFTADGMLVGTGVDDNLVAGKGQDIVQGLGGADTLSGMLGNDQLFGGEGNDLLLGGPGSDSLDGGNGSDTASYSTAPIGVTVSLALAGAQNTIGAGTDTLVAIENLTGSAWADTLTGNGDANVLTGGGDADVLDGGAGADRFVYFSASDSTAGARDRILNFQSGVDKIDLSSTGATAVSLAQITDASGSYTVVTAATPGGEMRIRVDGAIATGDLILPQHVPIIGTTGSDTLIGTPDDDEIRGLAGDDILDGRGGADTLIGGADNDRYLIDSAAEIVIEAANEGSDRVFAATSWMLTTGSSVETLSTIDNLATTAISLTGNSLTQFLYGNAGVNILDGGGGGDVMVGLGGDDFYYIRNVADRVVESTGGGYDRVLAAASFTLEAGSEVEKFTTIDNVAVTPINLTGNALSQYIYGNDGSNVLDGGGGGDVLVGLGGDDFYYIRNVADRVVEAAGGGYDRVLAAASFTLEAGSQVEKFTTVDNVATTAINLTGNALSQYIYGNAGSNILDGGGGGDVLVGLEGDDFYYTRNVADRVIEAVGAGYDRVLAAASFTLEAGSEVEKFTTVDNVATTAINLTGNGLSQYIYGNAGSNILDGGGGGDVLVGLEGDDSYYIRNAADRVVEAVGAGYDRVLAAASFTLEAGSEVEKFTTVDNVATTAINLTGNAINQFLYGNAGANQLDGKGGADVLTGFGGVDTFTFTSALGGGNIDRITDFVSGTDKIALDHGVFGLGVGALNANTFVIGTAAQDADDRIIYNSTTGALLFDADGNGATAAVQFATLDSHPIIAAGDFMVI